MGLQPEPDLCIKSRILENPISRRFSLLSFKGTLSRSMILNGCLANSGVSSLLLVRHRNPRSSGSFPRINASSSPSLVSHGSHFPAASTQAPFSPGKHALPSPTFPELPKRQQRLQPPRASKDVPQSYRYPPMTIKPRWWWRTLACLPYLMPLHETWMYAETAYHVFPFFEDFEFLTYPFLGCLGKLPGWFLMAYFFVAYLGVVRRKEWPHFFRFHVVMGMLLEIALQVVGTVSSWMPLAWYWGKAGMHFWLAVALGYMFTVLECIRCALAGMYADVPFVCDAAYIQIPYD